jgi:hypothetical protein
MMTPMDQSDKNRLIMEDCKASWHEEARARATEEATLKGLQGEVALWYVREREPVIYKDLEKRLSPEGWLL